MDNPWATDETIQDEAPASPLAVPATHRLDATTPSWDTESSDATTWKQPVEEPDEFVWGSEKAELSFSDGWQPPVTQFDDTAVYATPTFSSTEPDAFSAAGKDETTVSETLSSEPESERYVSTVSKEVAEDNEQPLSPILEDATDDPWTSPAIPVFEHDDPTVQDASWGNTWTAARPKSVEPEDEWQSAETRKAEFDRDIDNEALEDALRQTNELMEDMTPTVPSTTELSVPNIYNLAVVINAASQLAPENLTLPPIPSTGNANKRMAESVRATRNVPFLRLSPLAQYRSAKGSSAWEATVRSRPDIVKEDPSWKIKEKAEEIPIDSKRKSVGGLLSLFGRRNANATPALNEEQQPTSPSPRSSWTHSRTTSFDISPATPAPLPTPLSPEVTNVAKAETPRVAEPSTDSAAVGFDDVATDAAPPPSAVSRFFGRFSRSTSSGTHSRRNSLALSTDDMDFLSDTGSVPSYTDETNHEDDSFSLFATTPQKPAALPPLLPPPSNASAPRTQGQPSAEPMSAFTNGTTFAAPSALSQQSIEPDFSFLSSPSFRPASTSSTMAQPPVSRQSSSASRRTPVAIMSSSSTSPPAMQSTAFNLPPPPSTPRPLSPSTPSRASSFSQSFALSPPPKPPQTKTNALIGDFSSYASNSHYTSDSLSSMSSNQSLFSQSSGPGGKAHDPFDDFDDFVDGSSSFNILHTPPPPLPPPKPTSIRPPIQQQQPSFAAPTLFSQSTTPVVIPSPGGFKPPPMQNPVLPPPLKPTSSSNAPTSNGKLSAQDLSFFEGL